MNDVMTWLSAVRNLAATSAVSLSLTMVAALAEEMPTRLDTLYEQLADADATDAPRIAAEIDLELSKSGSAAMDLLLGRGRAALAQGAFREALAHLTALTDHAPDFAEGWYLRAQAHAELGQAGPALGDLERALLLEPRHYMALLQFAVLLEELDLPDLSLEAYTRVQDLYPQLTTAADGIKRLQAGGGETL